MDKAKTNQIQFMRHTLKSIIALVDDAVDEKIEGKRIKYGELLSTIQDTARLALEEEN